MLCPKISNEELLVISTFLRILTALKVATHLRIFELSDGALPRSAMDLMAYLRPSSLLTHSMTRPNPPRPMGGKGRRKP